MSFSPRFFIFLFTLLFLTGIGLIAGVNMIIRPQVDSFGQYSGEVLNSETAQEIKMVSEEPYIIATTTFVSNSDKTSTITQNKIPTLVPVPVKPQNQITASAYLVGNILTGKIYLHLDNDQALPVASMSKLMTAIVATNIISSTTIIEITPLETDVASDTSNLLVGEKFTLSELLKPLLLSSSNIAAEAIASSSPRLAFMGLMSNTAWDMGMTTAYFADPSGLDSHNKASTNDIFTLARYLYTSRPDILAITRTVHATLATTTNHGSHIVDSTHPFVQDSRFIGGKTGRTPDAGETMLTILKIKNQPIAIIVLHSDIGARARDTNLLIKKFEALVSLATN